MTFAELKLRLDLYEKLMRLSRALARMGGISYERIQTGRLQDDDWSRLTEAAEYGSRLPFYVDDQPALRLRLAASGRQLVEREFDARRNARLQLEQRLPAGEFSGHAAPRQGLAHPRPRAPRRCHAGRPSAPASRRPSLRAGVTPAVPPRRGDAGPMPR